MKSHSLPTVEAPRDFYLGGIYSAALFIMVAFASYQILVGANKIHSYALKKSSSVTVSLKDIPIQTSKTKDTPKPQPKPAPAPQSAPSEPAPVEDISSLFSSVDTNKIVPKKRLKSTKKIDTKRIASLQTRSKTSKKRKSTTTAEKVKQLSLVKPSVQNGGMTASGGEEVNRYYAKIQATIYAHFFPPVNSAGSVAKIRIWLSAEGKLMNFKVIRHSGEPLFDREVALLKKRLNTIVFERNPKGKETVLDVSLISKE